MKNLMIVTMLIFSGSAAFANGGVSDGGGGTTNPNPIKPELIIQVATQDAKRILLMWLNSAEEKYNQAATADQQLYPVGFLIRQKKAILNIIQNTGIELHLNKPCYDKNGSPFDGSIYAKNANAICISPFTMAPKLNQYNYAAETTALIMHEFSHLIGADEKQAVAIQESVLRSISNTKFHEAQSKLRNLADPANLVDFSVWRMMDMFQRMADHASDLNWNYIGNIQNFYLSRFTEGMRIAEGAYNALSDHTLKILNTEDFRVTIIGYAACALHDQSAGTRQLCATELEKCFQGESEVSVADLAARMGFPRIEPWYKEVIIGYPKNDQQVADELNKYRSFLDSIHYELDNIYRVQTTVYSIN